MLNVAASLDSKAWNPFVCKQTETQSSAAFF